MRHFGSLGGAALLRLVVVLLVGIVGAGAAIGAEFRLYYGPATTSRPAIDAREARPRTAGPALFEPKSGCYLGAYIELDPSLKNVFVDQNASRRKLPSEFELVVGKSHAMYFFYLGYGRPLPMDWVRYLAKHGGISPSMGSTFTSRSNPTMGCGSSRTTPICENSPTTWRGRGPGSSFDLLRR